ncbi:glycosyltransferase family 2 protein [Mucilaginibacter sp. L3T2-6]|uniref:glycosyltransferase n=1 Tax=Mucilaginibacter sp. L3T2-6 TaxID=3062491 RepID=UPI0026774887|nr:glycosyltransferase family 2 protein [Mucilaginibacter sp. L3T2-6]MDO3644592.1 glycosyltransferase family 2 protein [Mucilaginibacter sp. L3T2-6]MDV6217036.1 glycosyltransferase family 2 protein [Mucilaginibacter sp. L3T2-6]
MLIAISITLLFIVLRFTVTVFNFVSNPKLTRVNRHYDERVSILVPARNEQGAILPLLQSIIKQDYKNYEVIIYDDQSTDNTYGICEKFARTHSAVSIIKGDELPQGWLGKNYACHQLARKAKGKYLLFLDADTTICNGLINSAIHRMHINKLGLLSLFPNQQMHTFGEKVTVPLLNFLLLNTFPVRLAFLTKSPSAATACGQFMLFESESYHGHEWHRAAKDKVVEDAEIMQLVKSASYSGEVLLANGMMFCRMYRGYREALNGFSKNALAAFNYSIIGLLIYILLLFGGPMIILMTLNFNLILFTAGLIILSRIMISLASGQNALYNIILHPVQMVNMVIIAFLSIQKHLTKTNIWKGRRV